MSTKKKERIRLKVPLSTASKSPVFSPLGTRTRKFSFESKGFAAMNLCKDSPACTGRLQTLRVTGSRLNSDRTLGKKHFNPSLESMNMQYLEYLQVLEQMSESDPVNGPKLKAISQFIQQYVRFLSIENSSKVCETDRKPTTETSPKRTVPRLNFKSFSGQGFHQEFINKANEFSVSWREALNLQPKP